MSNHVTLSQLAQEFGIDRSNVRKYVLAHGFEFVRVRTPESRGQLTLALTTEGAESVRELRGREGFFDSRPVHSAVDGWGWFYIIQLVPELSSNRVKLGFASDVQSRLGAHRTSAPTAQLAQSWPCKRVWEQAAIDCTTRIECLPLSREVFVCDDLGQLADRAGQFFAVMPKREK